MHLSLRVERSETKQSQSVAIASLSLAMTQLILHTHLLHREGTVQAILLESNPDQIPSYQLIALLSIKPLIAGFIARLPIIGYICTTQISTYF